MTRRSILQDPMRLLVDKIADKSWIFYEWVLISNTVMVVVTALIW